MQGNRWKSDFINSCCIFYWLTLAMRARAFLLPISIETNGRWIFLLQFSILGKIKKSKKIGRKLGADFSSDGFWHELRPRLIGSSRSSPKESNSNSNSLSWASWRGKRKKWRRFFSPLFWRYKCPVCWIHWFEWRRKMKSTSLSKTEGVGVHSSCGRKMAI